MNLHEKKTMLFILAYKKGHYPVQISKNEYCSLMTLINLSFGHIDLDMQRDG